MARVEPLPLRIVDRQVEQRLQRREAGAQRPVERGEAQPQLAGDLADAVLVADIEPGAQQIGDDEMRRRAVVRHRRGAHHGPGIVGLPAEELVDEAGLAHAGLADDGDELAAAVRGAAQGARQGQDLGLAADEAREALRRRPHVPAAAPRRRDQLEDLDRRADALHLDRAERARLGEALGKPRGVRRETRGAGRCELLHPVGEMHGRADRVVIHRQIVADRADDDLAGIEPDPDLHRLAAELCRGVEHGARGKAGAHRVILMGEGGAEERHDAVALDAAHRAFVAMHRIDHRLEAGIEALERLLGVELLDQLHRAANVGEQHRHLLALALEAAPGIENAGDEMLRHIGRDGRRSRRRRRCCFGQRRSAIAAEARIRPVRMTAGRAALLQRGAARIAKPVAVRVFGCAPAAQHRWQLLDRSPRVKRTGETSLRTSSTGAPYSLNLY